jgi:hypothetical protein
MCAAARQDAEVEEPDSEVTTESVAGCPKGGKQDMAPSYSCLLTPYSYCTGRNYQQQGC